MLNSLKFRLALIAVLVVGSVWLLVQRGITLGLDLQGGTHLALEVSDPSGALTAEQRADAIDRALQVIRTRVDELGVAEPSIQKQGKERIIVELPGASHEAQQRARDVIQKTAFLEFKIAHPISELAAALPRIDRALVEAGVAPAGAAKGGAAQPGVGGLFENAPDSAAGTANDTAAAAHPFSAKVVPASEITFMVAEADVPAVQRYLARPEVQRLLPRGLQLSWGVAPKQPGAQDFLPLYLLETRSMMTGEYLTDAQAQRDPQLGRPIVIFQLNRRGGRIFERATGEHVGDPMAIVLDQRVYSAPIINSQIADRGQIELTGGTIEEARDLALVLRAGALPVPVHIVEERTIGPSLGTDSIAQGQLAGIIGIALVILFMVVFYKLSGIFAVGALALYVVYNIGLLAGIGATLTFPGIAGFILSIGMAVDANVLIYERIREEMDVGRSVRVAVDQGFVNALPAIIDSNLTTLITCAILFQFGTGPVKGFAVTLAIGLISSLFTAIFVTRTFFLLYLSRRKATQGLSI